jgi:membrane peptidoglycan carboxypeptidase
VMTDMLKGVILRGTGVAANIGIPSAGKTGTADDYRNAWFIGYTPYLVTTVWVGNDDDSAMNKVTGGEVPAGIWAALMKQATAKMPHDDWTQPDGVVQEAVCGSTGLLAGPGCPDPRTDLFIKGTEPAVYVAPVTPAVTAAATTTPPATVDAAQPAGGTAPPAEAASDGPLTVTLSAPADGAQVAMPFTVQGTTQPAATVHIVVQGQGASGGAAGAQVADVYLRADSAGAFAFQVRPWTASPAGAYVVTVTASLGLQSATATVTVKPQ